MLWFEGGSEPDIESISDANRRRDSLNCTTYSHRRAAACAGVAAAGLVGLFCSIGDGVPVVLLSIWAGMIAIGFTFTVLTILEDLE